MSEWQWFVDYYRDACYSPSPDRRRMLELHDQAFDVRERDPDRTLALFGEGCRLAEQLEEPWWALLFEQWQCHGLIYYKNDFRHVLDRVIRNVLELRKSIYDQYPQRLWIYNDLVTVYLNVDPLGFEKEIEDALAQIEAELKTQTDDSTYLWLENKIEFLLAKKQWQEALDLTYRGLDMAESDGDRHRCSHYLIAIHGYLCQLAFERRNWRELKHWAEAAEESARGIAYQYPLSLAQMWQALVAKKTGDEMSAARLYRSSLRRKDNLQWPPCRNFYEAWSGYHILRDNPLRALQVREQQFNAVRGRGQLVMECHARIEQCRLRKLLDQLDEQHVAAARRAANKLRRPETYLAELELIAKDERGQ